MKEGPESGGNGSGRARRIVTVLLALIQLGAGHFPLGSFRRLIAWAVGVAVLGFTLLPAGFALPAGGSVGGVPIRYTRGLYPQTPRREDPDFRERAQGGAEASDCTLLRDSRAWPLLRR